MDLEPGLTEAWLQELLDLIREQQNDDQWGHIVSPEPRCIPMWDLARIVDTDGNITHLRRAKFRSGRKIKRIRAKGSIPHGDHVRYAGGCRCDDCRKAASELGHAIRRANGIRPKTPPQHGTPSGYQKLKCRCEECKAAWNEYMRGYNQRRKAA